MNPHLLAQVATEPVQNPIEALWEMRAENNRELWNTITEALFNTVNLYPNPSVEEVYQVSLTVTYLFVGLALAYAGLLYLVREPLGIETRAVLPRLIMALLFAAVALPVLQYGVELSDALVRAFQPTEVQASLGEQLGLDAGVALAVSINGWLLLAIAVIFILRNVYLLFVAAISPLLALAWALPNSNRYAQSFISGWFAVLAMAPMDALALRFILAMTEGSAGLTTTSLTNWVLGVAAFSLLLWIPIQLYGASQSAVGFGFVITQGFRKGLSKVRGNQPDRPPQNQDSRRGFDRRQRRRGPR